MRRIEWEVGTTRLMIERASAIAWAASRRGQRMWHGKNVTADIKRYLDEHGYKIEYPMTVMKKLVDEGYCYIHYSEGKHRVREFGFLPDVDLVGHHLPGHTEEGVQKLQTLKDKPSYTGPASLPPLPAAPEPTPFRLDDLVKHLKEWSQTNPEAYANWVEAAIESLQANT